MIKNVIFDIGNVLTNFRWKEFLADKGFSGDMIRRIAAVTVENPLWEEVDRGVWTAEQVMDAFVEAAPEMEADLHRAYDDIHGLVTRRDYAIPWLCKLKENGCGVWYLSNFSLKAEKECAEALDFMPYMDGGILSHREKMIKPDPNIYKLLLERYGLTAEECVFIDDTPANVEAAVQLGIRGIVFRSREQVEEELRALGVPI